MPDRLWMDRAHVCIYRHAIIEYPTRSGMITQAISDDHKKYTLGQKFKVRYAVKHPDMFIVIEGSLEMTPLYVPAITQLPNPQSKIQNP